MFCIFRHRTRNGWRFFFCCQTCECISRVLGARNKLWNGLCLRLETEVDAFARLRRQQKRRGWGTKRRITGERKRMGKRRVASTERHRIRRSNRCHAPAGNIYCARDPLERVRRTSVYYYHQIGGGGGRTLRAGTSEHFRESPQRRVSVDLLFTCAKETDKNRHFRARWCNI